MVARDRFKYRFKLSALRRTFLERADNNPKINFKEYPNAKDLLKTQYFRGQMEQ